MDDIIFTMLYMRSQLTKKINYDIEFEDRFISLLDIAMVNN